MQDHPEQLVGINCLAIARGAVTEISCGVLPVDNQQATFPTGRARKGRNRQEQSAKEAPTPSRQG